MANLNTDFDLQCLHQGWGFMNRNQSILRETLHVGSHDCKRGLGTHADSKIGVYSQVPMMHFHAWAGIDVNRDTLDRCHTQLVFSIEAQGKELWNSGKLSLKDSAEADVELPEKCHCLKLHVDTDNISLAHADWGDAYVTTADGQKIYLDEMPTNQPFRFEDELSTLPISFVYGGVEYHGFDPAVFRTVKVVKGQNGKRHQLLTELAFEQLKITVDFAYYDGFCAYEYTVWFENGSAENSKILKEVRCADVSYNYQGGAAAVSGILGDHINMYRPYRHLLNDGGVFFDSDLGRPTHVWFPYFNLDLGDGNGMLIALGWGGTWRAHFSADCEKVVRFTAESCTGFAAYLKPGEKVRTALMAFLPYEIHPGDPAYAGNLWRRWYLECNLPKANAQGEPLKPLTTACFAQDTGKPNSDGSISEGQDTWRRSMEAMLAGGIHPDFRWFDAGWYCDPEGKTVPTDWWGTVGTWELDPAKWPGDSFRQSVDFGHAHGFKTLTWFEPERVSKVPALCKNYGYRPEWAYINGSTCTNDLGNPECLQWTLGRILKFFEKTDNDLYREDHNSDPFFAWHAGDAKQGPDRVGTTENHDVQGHYALWDGIIDYCAKHGKCTFVDSCASGGGRNDLESMRRGIPLMRSDFDRTTIAIRLSMNYGFNAWIPFFGTSMDEKGDQLCPNGTLDKYTARSAYNPVMILGAQWYVDPKTDYPLLRDILAEWKSINPLLLKDYYPLTEWTATTDDTQWSSYLYLDPDTQEGVLFGFRQNHCQQPTCRVKLTMLKPDLHYALTDADTGKVTHALGRVLARGLTLRCAQPHESTMIRIAAVS